MMCYECGSAPPVGGSGMCGACAIACLAPYNKWRDESIARELERSVPHMT